MAAVLLCLCLLLGARYDYYWDLNDDFLIDRILNGAYTGVPAAHDIQNLFPFSALVSALTRLLPGSDWYAVLLLGLQFLCLGVVALRVGQRIPRREGTGNGQTGLVRKFLCMAAALAVLLGEMLYHLVFVQYSVTVGLMAAAAAVILMTVRREELTDDHGRVRILRVLHAAWGALALIAGGFAIRSEMLLFCSPFIALAGIFRGYQLFCVPENVPVPGQNRQSRTGVWILTLLVSGAACVGLLKGIDVAAYSSPAWREFRAFFDARTQLYDFEYSWMKPYEDDRAFYDALGLDASEVTLLWNYNFGLDENITADKLEAIAAHAAQTAGQEDPVRQRLGEAFWNYRKTFTDAGLLPQNLLSTALYLLLFAEAVRGRESVHRKRGGKLLLGGAAVFVIRSGLYLYLLYNRRPVARLTHCLYLMEAVLLLLLVLQALEEDRAAGRMAAVPDPTQSAAEQNAVGESGRLGQGESVLTEDRALRGGAGLAAAVIVVCGLAAAVLQLGQMDTEFTRREQVNRSWTAFLSYVGEHPDAFYFVDVYSTVDFSEKMLDNRKVMASNWDFAGGWACKSPLWQDKLQQHNLTTMETALTGEDRVYFAAAPGQDTDWLADYYRFRGQDVQVELVDTVPESLCIYRVETVGAGTE